MFGQTRDVLKFMLSKNAAWWRDIIKKSAANPTVPLHHLYYNIKRWAFDFLAKLGVYKYKYNIIFLAGMPLSATTWVKNMFGRVPGYFTRFSPMPYDVSIKQDFCDSAFKHVPSYGYTLFKTHLNPTDVNLNIILKNRVKKVIVTHRDFRDVVISRYNRLIKVPKKPGDPHYTDLSKMTKEEAINESIEKVSDIYVPWMDGWIKIAKEHKDFVYFCAFEKLRNDPKGEFKKMLAFYEIELSEEKIDEIIKDSKGKGTAENNWAKGSLQPWAIASNFRSGKIGGWKNEFTDENIKYCEKLLGKELIRHGYEKDNSWANFDQQ